MNFAAGHRKKLIPALILLASTLSCMLLPQSLNPGGSSSPTPPAAWKLSQDATGACQVSTPSGWQLGKDFFLAVETAGSSLFPHATAEIPPVGDSLWQSPQSTPFPEGKQFQMRTSLVIGSQVCSVWRIKSGSDFNEAEKTEMDRVGQTLQEVK